MLKSGIIACALVSAFALEAQARAMETPQELIDTVSQDAVDFLSDEVLSDEEAGALLGAVNVDAISRFALGRYVHQANDAELASYQNAFELYLADQLQTHMSNFSGSEFNVVDTVEREPGDVVVETQVTNAAGETFPVSWRVKSFDGDWQIIDVEFEGLWLIIEQRAQFQAALDANGGDISALTDSF